MSTAPNAQSTAPSISLATLRAVLARGQTAHPELACRMERAAHIVALRRIDTAMAPENKGVGYWVEASDGSREYWVTLDPRGYRGDRCSCPDYRQRGGPCKHAIAVRLLQACQRRERTVRPAEREYGACQNVVPFPAPTLDPDAPIPYELTDKALAALDAAPTPSA